MSKKHPASTNQTGTVTVDPPPASLTLLTGGDEERERATQEAQAQWEAEFRGALLAGAISYAAEQWSVAGLDPGAVMRAIADAKDPILADAVIALTDRPQAQIRKPRQDKSKWTAKEQGELVLAVRNRLDNKPILHGPKVTLRTVCARLVGRNGPEKWRGNSGTGLEARYREALKSPVGLVLDHMLSEAARARSEGKIDADGLTALMGYLDRWVASL